MTIAELNRWIAEGLVGEAVALGERWQQERLARIVDAVRADSRIRLVLVTGGSSSGKTTVSRHLRRLLADCGRAALSLSIDDYYAGRDRYPLDEAGRVDYEDIRCIDTAQLGSDLATLFAGGTVYERRYDFTREQPFMTGGTLTLAADGLIVLEGLHALNPAVVKDLPSEWAFRISVELRPRAGDFPQGAPSSDQIRFLRRMIRDSHARGLPPLTTFERWPVVRAGERRWIEPFLPLADAVVDTFAVHELAELRLRGWELLQGLRRDTRGSPEVLEMVRLLEPVLPAECVS